MGRDRRLQYNFTSLPPFFCMWPCFTGNFHPVETVAIRPRYVKASIMSVDNRQTKEFEKKWLTIRPKLKRIMHKTQGGTLMTSASLLSQAKRQANTKFGKKNTFHNCQQFLTWAINRLLKLQLLQFFFQSKRSSIQSIHSVNSKLQNTDSRFFKP